MLGFAYRSPKPAILLAAGPYSFRSTLTLEEKAPQVQLSQSGFDQTIEGDRKLANADTGRVPDRIGDRAGGSRDADLADALDAERVDVRVVLLDENGFERGNVGVHRHMIFAEIRRSSDGRNAGPCTACSCRANDTPQIMPP